MRTLSCSAHWFIAAVGQTRHLKTHGTGNEQTLFKQPLVKDDQKLRPPVTWLGDCVFPSFSFSCDKLLFMFRKSWQVKEQVPALISVFDVAVDLTETEGRFQSCHRSPLASHRS